MCRNILIGLVLTGIAILALGAAVFQYTGWPGFLAYLVVLGLGLVLLKGMLPRILRYFVLSRIRKLGKGLNKAVVTHSSIIPAPAPSNAADLDDRGKEAAAAIGDLNPSSTSRDDLSWNWVEVTVEPKKADDSWSLSALTLARSRKGRSETRAGIGQILAPLLDDGVITSSVERWDGSHFVPVETDTVTGTQRLRFLVGFRSEVEALSLLYFHMIEIAEIPIPRLRIQADTAP